MKKRYFLFCVLFSFYLNASVIYVNKDALGANNGTSWINAYNTIEQAFGNSIVGDQIWIAQGVYKPIGTSRSTSYIIPNGVEVYGSFVGNETSVSQRTFLNGPTTTLNGDINSIGVQTDNCYTVVKFVNASSLTIFDGFKIINGYNNSSSYGGAIYNQGGQPTIKNCDLIANYATNGGAFGNNTSASLVTTLISCKIKNNSAYLDGGAIINQSGTLKLINCDISNNTAVYGGAVNVTSNLLIADRCIFSGNSASGNGGAIYLDNTNSSIEMYNSLIVGNYAPEKSVMGMNSPVSNTNVSKIIGCTIVNNRNASTDPNSSFVIIMPYNNGVFRNNIMTNNISPRVLLNGYVSNCIIDEIIAANSTANVTTIAPSFVNANIAAAAPFAHNEFDYKLNSGSVGINLGNNSFNNPLYNLDLSGSSRVYDVTVDVGAYEFSGNLSNTDSYTLQDLVIYPNPTSNLLYFKNFVEEFTFKIYSINGVLLKEGALNENNKTIDITNFKTGTYFVKTSNNQQFKVIKK